MPDGRQPALHDLVTVLCAPNVAISGADGQLDGEGVHGIYRHDRRALACLRISVDGAELMPTGFRMPHAGHACFHGIVREQGDLAADPTVRYVRERHVDRESVTETWTLHNDSASCLETTVTLSASTDLAGMDAVKSGKPSTAVTPSTSVDRSQWTLDDSAVVLTPSRQADAASNGVWTWRIAVPAGGQWTLKLDVELREEHRDAAFLPQRPHRPVALVPPDSTGNDVAGRLLSRSLDDLDALLLADTDRPDASFLAAGSPWFLTLFGRDSLWAARFLLPLSTELAYGTLRVLAARQGTQEDPGTEEEPGKIPHELRRGTLDVTSSDDGRRLRLPPLYYGTVDATALWVCLLYEAWRAGLAESRVEALLPALRAALEWIGGAADPDGDGFCEYAGSAANGLANQGWKDSDDGIRWSDGTLALRPLALCEVQGYAHAAALGGAALLDAFGGEGAHWRRWAADLRTRFRDAFWVSDEHGRYPAIALDGDKRPVTGPASNMAHLLGTGLLDSTEISLVVQQLSSPWLDGEYGLRTMSSRTAGFNPLSYHCGSVWPHDTAIAVFGLAAEGHHRTARSLAEGLLRAADQFDYRLPELYGGTDYRAGEPAVAYPAACRPQAWSAAGAVAVVGYLRGWPHPLLEPRRWEA